MTLVEIMVSFGIFAIVAGGVIASLLHTQRLAASNLSQTYAHATAQSIIEEIIRLPPAILADPAETEVAIRVASLTSTNRTALDEFSLPWATTSTDFTAIGSTAEGVLMDAAYIESSNIIRPERYMLMRLNLQREIESADHRVRIVLRYQWAVPDRKSSDGSPLYLSGEIRTFRSMALRF